jgi:hypothetical protein
MSVILVAPSGRMFCASLPFGSPWLTFFTANKDKKIVTEILAAHDRKASIFASDWFRAFIAHSIA